MGSLEDDSLNTKSSIQTLMKAAAASRSVMLQPPLNFSAVKRLVDIDEGTEEVIVNEDTTDSLAKQLVEAGEDLSASERQGSIEVSVEPLRSIAALFDKNSQAARELKPRLFLAWDVSSAQKICGILTVCEMSRDPALGTQRMTQSWMAERSIPRLSAGNTLFIDVVSSSGDPRGVGALLVLNAYQTVYRSRKYDFLASIAVSARGKTLFEQLGFSSVSYRENGQRTFCWIRAGELKASDISQRLRIDRSLPSLCWRFGFTSKSSSRRYPRC